jgi:signal transduction histidine kinase
VAWKLFDFLSGGTRFASMSNDMELIRNLEQILSTLRHELGNSINSLKISLDVLRENYEVFDDAKRKEYLERGLKLLMRQQQLVDAMKSYSQFRVNEQNEIRFLSFWTHFLSAASEKLKGGRIKLISRQEIEPCVILGDRAALNKVMTSILDNAVEAVEEQEEPLIELVASKSNGWLKIVLADNGSGIQNNDLTRIFTPLFSTKSGKTGMGLSIAQKLTLEMKGKMSIESSPGKGTQVTVWLKCAGVQKREHEKTTAIPVEVGQ